MTPADESGNLRIPLKMPRFSIGDALKLGSYLVLFILAWARVESAIENITTRLDKIEASQISYVRADVAQARQETLGTKLDGMSLRLERIEMKIDYQDRSAR